MPARQMVWLNSLILLKFSEGSSLHSQSRSAIYFLNFLSYFILALLYWKSLIICSLKTTLLSLLSLFLSRFIMYGSAKSFYSLLFIWVYVVCSKTVFIVVPSLILRSFPTKDAGIDSMRLSPFCISRSCPFYNSLMNFSRS